MVPSIVLRRGGGGGGGGCGARPARISQLARSCCSRSGSTAASGRSPRASCPSSPDATVVSSTPPPPPPPPSAIACITMGSPATARWDACRPSSPRQKQQATSRRHHGSSVSMGSSYSDRRSRSASSAQRQQQEVDKFSAMDGTWWDPLQNPLLAMNAVRVEYIRQQILDSLLPSNEELLARQGRRVLDVGCGGGLLCESLKRLNLWRASSSSSTPSQEDVVGIDPSSRLIEVAKRHAALDPRTSDIAYHCTTVEAYAAEAVRNLTDEEEEEHGLFDVICLLEVVEHVDDPAHLDAMMAAISRLLRTNGLLFVSTVNQTWKSHLLTIVGAEYVMRYLPIGTHQWSLYKSPGDVEKLLERHGLHVVGAACGMVPTSIPLPMLPSLLSPSWKWRLDPTDTDVNWIGTYRKL